MTLKKNILAGFTLVVASGFVAQSFVAHHAPQNISSRSNVMRSIAQVAGVTFQDVERHYRENVNKTGIIVSDYLGVIDAVIDLHLASPQHAGGLVLMNNIGASDGSYKDHEQIKNMARQDIIKQAIELRANAGGGTIVVVAGNTNTGVGLIVTAAQEPAFVERILSQYNVRVITGGLSSEAAVLSHGDYEKNSKWYGTDFMNNKLDVSAAISDPSGSWQVTQNGVSQVAKLSLYFNKIVRERGDRFVKSIITVTEGGPITMQEVPQAMLETERLAKEWGVDPKEVINFVLKQGIESGVAVNEVKANKGPAGVTDLLLAMYRVGHADPSIIRTLEALGVRLERYRNGVQIFAGEITKDSLARSVEAILSTEQGKSLMQRAQSYTAQIRSIDPKDSNAKQKIYEIDKSFGILADKDANGVKVNELADLVKEIKELNKSQANPARLQELKTKLEAHKQGARVRAFANAILNYLNTLNELSKSYKTNATKDISPKEKAGLEKASERLENAFKKALSANQFEVVNGSAQRSFETEAKKAVRDAKR